MTKAIGTAHVPPTTETTHRIPIAGLPACPAWCVEHAEMLPERRFIDPSVTHYGHEYAAPVTLDGEEDTLELRLYRFDEDPAAGKADETKVYTTFGVDGIDHGIDMTVAQARSLHAQLGAMLAAAGRETTRPDTIADPSACPVWCPGGCASNDDRLHEKVLAEFVAVDSDSHEDDPRQVNVRLLIERYDTLVDAHLVDEPIRTRALVEFVHEIGGKVRVIRAAMTSTQLRDTGCAALEAADLLDAATAIERR